MTRQSDRSQMVIKINRQTSPVELLSGLEQWLELGLLADSLVELKLEAGKSLRESSLCLEMATVVERTQLLAGLKSWQALGLLEKAQIELKVRVSVSHPCLLDGLETWLSLGLLTQLEIKQLSRDYLSCRFTPVIPSPVAPPRPRIAPADPPPAQPIPRRQREKTPALAQIARSLMAELSVLWLLLLGAFMVVLSSGVLAASQWEKFPAAAQYGILWLYTIAFGAGSWWASQQPNLRLTAQTLRAIALLLVPVNFLAIDSFHLWHSPLDWLIVALASLSLSALSVQLFRPQRISLINHLGLSYLHWGWTIPFMPLFATYCGVVGTAVITLVRPPSPPREGLPFSLNGAIIATALGILLVRAIFIADVDILRLGLALGICGWLLLWNKPQNPVFWSRIGGSLLALGWGLSAIKVPWQAIAVSLLALVWLGRRLLRHWLRLDLAAIFLIGLQIHWLIWRLLSPDTQQVVLTWATGLTGSQDAPWTLLSLGLFPYLVLILALANGFSRLDKHKLANFNEKIAIFLGTALIALSLANPLLRTLSLTGSTVALATVTRRKLSQGTNDRLCLLTHIGILLSFVAGIDCVFPVLSLNVWAVIFLGLMAGEGAFYLIPIFMSRDTHLIPPTPVKPTAKQPLTPPFLRGEGGDQKGGLSTPTLIVGLRQSAWGLSLILGGLSFGFLCVNPPILGIIWLIAPLVLTAIATWHLSKRILASWLSVGALGMLQLLTWEVPETRLIGLITAAGLMAVNTRNLRHWGAAAITLAFPLAAVGVAVEFWLISLSRGFLALAIATFGLWLLRHALSQRNSELAKVYALAADGWGFTLCSLSLCALLIYFRAPSSEILPTAIILMLATAYRSASISQNTLTPPFLRGVRGDQTFLRREGGDQKGELSTIQNRITWFSVFTLLYVQIPLWGDWRVIAIATLLMFLHARTLKTVSAAAISVGLGLGLIASGLWEIPLRSPLNWLWVGAITVMSLWGVRHALSHRQGNLAQYYAKAIDGWAITLFSVNLIILANLRESLLNPIAVTCLILLLMLATAYRSWQPPYSISAIWLSIAMFLLLQALIPSIAAAYAISFGLATGLMLIHTRYLKQLPAAFITVGFGIGWLATCLWLGMENWQLRSFSQGLLAGMLVLAGLWGLWRILSRREGQLAALYANALDYWAIALSSLALLSLTLHSLAVYGGWLAGTWESILSAGLLLAAIAFRSWQQPNNWAIYGMGWSLELLAIEVLGITGKSILALAIANTLLGLLVQILGNWLYRRTNRQSWLNSWHILPLLYGAIGTALRWNFFSHWTGLSSLGLVLIVLGVGRRREALKPLLYLGLVGISLACAELLLYQVANLPTGDRFLALAALFTSLMYAYRLLSPGLSRFLSLKPVELKIFAHLHWLLASFLLGAAVFYPSDFNPLTGLATGIFLTRYAIMQGRNHSNAIQAEIWVYLGILEASAISLYAAQTISSPPFLAHLLATWQGTFVALSSLGFYALPWQEWGWPIRPWRLTAFILPLVGVGMSVMPFNQVAWLIAAGCYALFAQMQQRRRWFYLSLLLGVGAITHWLFVFNLNTPLAQAILLGLSIFCAVWIEPACQNDAGKNLRHFLRLIGTSIICGTALWDDYQTGIIPGILSILAIFSGLAFRIRAFLYIGTLTFVLNAFYQLVILSVTYPLLKWIVGLLLGLGFIWIAASFENRRTQLMTLFRHWMAEFAEWD